MSSLEPTVFEDLWYYDSVVRLKAPQHPPRAPPPPPPLESSSSTLPLSTGGESSPRPSTLLPIFTEEEEEEVDGYGPRSSSSSSSSSTTSCTHCTKASSQQQQHPLCGIVEKIKHEDELSAEDMEEWMRKLGLEYTEDRMMVRRSRKHQSRLNGEGEREEDPETVDFAEFVCVSRFIEEETGPSPSPEDEDSMNSSLHRVFRLFDPDHKGLICPHELRAALAQLGLGRKIPAIATAQSLSL